MDSKSIFLSKTLWANAITVVALLLARYGIQLDPDTQATLATAALTLVNIVMRLLSSGAVHVIPPSNGA